MEVSNNSLLNILLPNQNAVLKEALKSADNNELKNLLQNKNLSSQEILKSIFEQIKNPDKSNQSLLNMLKNSSLLKDIGSFSSNISDLTTSLKNDSNLKSFANTLENFTKNIKDINPNNLEQNIKNSGIFLESKLANISNITNMANLDNKNIIDDLKTILLKTNEEAIKSNPEVSKQIDKLLVQIETSQMYSLLSNSNYVYIPFLWENLEDGNLELKKSETEDFYCKINLTLKNFGKVEITLGVFNNIDFEIYANFENENLKTLFKKKIATLKEGFTNQEINLKVLRINDLNENDKSKSTYEKNTYDEYSSILKQVDIKV